MISLQVIKGSEVLGKQPFDCSMALDALSRIVCMCKKYQLTLTTVERQGFVLEFDYLLAIPGMKLAARAEKAVAYHFSTNQQAGAAADYDYLRLLVSLHAYVITTDSIRCHIEVLSNLQYQRNTCIR